MELNADEERFKHLVNKYIPHIEDKVIYEFFTMDYTILFMENDGFLGYVEDDDYIHWAFLYDGKLRKNFKKALKIAKKLKKPIIYTGKKNFYQNNSIDLGSNIYQLVI